jgi:lipopolysaccharide transport system ATP-binding protein
MRREVGTGFHAELTGRENIYLNGAILGMSRTSIRGKFDDIVSFAEVEKFIDTPVKHYSNGMYLRLAFAVAAHLEPDILLVDEVLAVGDAAFQQKCLHKMGDVTQEGRTVLFVSHNMGAISTLCRRAIWLRKGRLAQDGAVSSTVTAYLNASSATSGRKVWAPGERPGNRAFTLTSATLKNSAGEMVSEVYLSETITVEVEFEVNEPGTKVVLSLNLWDERGSEVFSSLSNTADNPLHGKPLQPGRYRSQCVIYGNLLNEGRYYVTFIGVSGYWSDGFRTDYALAFNALEDGVLKRDYPGKYGGVVRPQLSWTTRRLHGG